MSTKLHLATKRCGVRFGLQFWCLVFLPLLLLHEGIPTVRGNDEFQKGKELEDANLSHEQFRILDTQEVQLGTRSIIYHRVETPILKPQPEPLATPAPTPAPIPSAEELAEQARWDAFPQMNLFMSCTVYNDALSQGSFHHEGVNVVFWSTINFHYLSQTYDLMTPDCYYYLFVTAGDSTK